LTGFDLETVTSFLQFIYSSGTRSVKVTDLGVDEARHFRKGQLNMPLLRLADQYEVRDLKALCVANLKRNRDIKGMLDIWNAAEELNIGELKLSNDSIGRYVSAAGAYVEGLEMKCQRCGSMKIVNSCENSFETNPVRFCSGSMRGIVKNLKFPTCKSHL